MDSREKALKYSRDLDTERGLINCLHRETKQCCDCLATKKYEANGMSKMQRCIRCHEVFPKADMMKCDGCEMVVYCSKTCCIQDWPCHRTICKDQQWILSEYRCITAANSERTNLLSREIKKEKKTEAESRDNIEYY